MVDARRPVVSTIIVVSNLSDACCASRACQLDFVCQISFQFDLVALLRLKSKLQPSSSAARS